MDSYPPPAGGIPLRWPSLRLVAGLIVAVLVATALAFVAPPVQSICRWALDFSTTRTVPSYVDRPLAEAMAERSYCVRPSHNDLTCDPADATVVSQSIAGPQNPLHSTSQLTFEARC